MVLAYSGGLDTSVILKWLQETYECEVVTFTADLGQVQRLPRSMHRASVQAGWACTALAVHALAAVHSENVKDLGNEAACHISSPIPQT